VCLGVFPYQTVKPEETAVARQQLGEHVPAATNEKFSTVPFSHFSILGRMWEIKTQRQLSGLSSPRGLNRFPRDWPNYFKRTVHKHMCFRKAFIRQTWSLTLETYQQEKKVYGSRGIDMSTWISVVLNPLLICRLCCKPFWNIINKNIKVHENELTVGSYLPLSWNASSDLVELAEILSISRHSRSQNSEASHTVW
jgi:hypothetical protein